MTNQLIVRDVDGTVRIASSDTPHGHSHRHPLNPTVLFAAEAGDVITIEGGVYVVHCANGDTRRLWRA